MKFREIKRQALYCLQQGNYDHEVRRDIDIKNVFASRRVDRYWVMDLIARTAGDNWHCTPHHQQPDIDVHLFRSWKAGQFWYVKFYFLAPDMVFISVHPS